MEPRVTFAPGLASDVVKPSRPSRKIPTEKDYGPLAYAIILPRRAMLPRLAETDPDIIENVDLAKVWAQSNAIEASLENMCDEARKIWPNTFGCIVDPTFEDGSCYALGFADNTRFENDTQASFSTRKSKFLSCNGGRRYQDHSGITSGSRDAQNKLSATSETNVPVQMSMIFLILDILSILQQLILSVEVTSTTGTCPGRAQII
ncbi:MAG: hypothetical protein NXY57DRAFT_1038894 [Lentinula lateritia]|nr:MAG: hypothetical protein NXY57DRAFT_1038894 [Lentinula lateritia]